MQRPGERWWSPVCSAREKLERPVWRQRRVPSQAEVWVAGPDAWEAASHCCFALLRSHWVKYAVLSVPL